MPDRRAGARSRVRADLAGRQLPRRRRAGGILRPAESADAAGRPVPESQCAAGRVLRFARGWRRMTFARAIRSHLRGASTCRSGFSRDGFVREEVAAEAAPTTALLLCVMLLAARGSSSVPDAGVVPTAPPAGDIKVR